jgi:hypothetical protein
VETTYKFNADNQTWLGGKSPNSMEAYSWEIIELNAGFSSKQCLITRRELEQKLTSSYNRPQQTYQILPSIT